MRRLGQFWWFILPLAGLLVWAVYFMAAYAFVAVACAQGFADADLLGARAATVVPLLLACIGCGLIGLAWLKLQREKAALSDGHERTFLVRAGRIVSILSLLAIALSALPAWLLSC
jgi:hypothetical protein